MGYLIERDEKVSSAIRRIAEEQVSDALSDLDDPDAHGGAVEAVHDCRKRCKKLRGVVRLVRPSMGADYTRANDTFRDAARALSGIRDAQAVLGTFDNLVAASRDQLPDGGLVGVRAGLEARANAATAHVAADQGAMVEARGLLIGGAKAIGDWSFDDGGWDAVAGGLAKTYRRGRKALAEVREAPSVENFHELRKRAKYTWYHVRLVADAAPSVLGPLTDRFHDLSDTLGDAHDLAVLGAQLREEPEAFGDRDEVDAALVIVDGHRVALEEAAVSLGSRLYAEKADAFADRLGRYWAVWHALGDELPAGEIADLHPPKDDLGDRELSELRAIAEVAVLDEGQARSRDDLIGAIRARG